MSAFASGVTLAMIGHQIPRSFNMMLLMAMLVAAGVSGGIAATLLMLSVGLSPRALR